MASCIGKLVGEIFNTDPVAGVLKWKDSCYRDLTESQQQIIRAVYNTNRGQFLKVTSLTRGDAGMHRHGFAVDFGVRFAKHIPYLYYTYVDLIKSGWGGAVLLASPKLSAGSKRPALHLHVDTRLIGPLHGFEINDRGVKRDSEALRRIVRKEYGAESDSPPGLFGFLSDALSVVKFFGIGYLAFRLLDSD